MARQGLNAIFKDVHKLWNIKSKWMKERWNEQENTMINSVQFFKCVLLIHKLRRRQCRNRPGRAIVFVRVIMDREMFEKTISAKICRRSVDWPFSSKFYMLLPVSMCVEWKLKIVETNSVRQHVSQHLVKPFDSLNIHEFLPPVCVCELWDVNDSRNVSTTQPVRSRWEPNVNWKFPCNSMLSCVTAEWIAVLIFVFPFAFGSTLRHFQRK